MKIYISSTFQDLREHRAAVDLGLRRMGHDVLGMEQYVAEGTTPLEKCLQDVRSSDAYLVIVGWRYGFVPTHSTLNPDSRSITELEYQAPTTSAASFERPTTALAEETGEVVVQVDLGRHRPSELLERR